MSAELDRLEVVLETQASSTNKELDKLVAKLEKIEKSLSNIKWPSGMDRQAESLNRGMSGMIVNANASSVSMKKLSSALTSYASKAYSATHRTRSLAQSWGMFYATFYPIIRGVKALGRSIESSMDYIETFNYFNVTMDKIGKEFSNQYGKYGYDSAESYVDSFSNRLNDLTRKMTGYKVGDDGMLSSASGMNLGLDPQKIMNYQASISAITNSVGLAGETSINTSKALTMLAADMSSFKNVDLQTVVTNFQSGLIGQSRALYKYGIDITNATLQTYAYKYGLSTAVAEMTQADKMQLRLLAILDQSRVAWGDQANTINSVANQYRILKQQISNVARTIGNLLIPIAQAVLPVVNGVMMALGRLFSFVGPLIYGAEKWKGIMDGISSGYGGIDVGDIDDGTADIANNAGNIGSNLDNASKAAKKLQRTILGFDQINKLADNTDTSSAGSSAGKSDGGVGGIDLSNEIGAALADYEAVWNKAFENSVNQAQAYADKICAVFNNMWNMIKGGEFEELGAYIASGVDSVFGKINSVFNWEKMGPGITGFMDGFVMTINSFVTNVNWGDIGKTFGDGLNVITNTLYLWYAGIDWINIGTAIASGMNGMINSIDWLMLGRTVGAWIMKIPEMIYGFVTNLNWAGLGQGIGNALNGVLMEFDGKTIAGGINGIVNGILSALKAFIKTVDWSEVAKAVGDVLGNLDWGTLAAIGLTLGAVKLATLFGSILATQFGESVGKMVGGKMDNILAKLPPKIDGVLSSIAGKFSSGGGIYEAAKGMAIKLSAAFGNLTGISIPVGGVIAGIVAAIGLVIAGIIDLWKTSETFRDNVKNMLGIIGGAFLYAKQQIWDNGLKPLWDSISEFFGSLYGIYESSGLKDIFELVVTNIGYVASEVLGGLIVAISEFVQFLANAIQGAVEVLNVMLDYVKGFLNKHKEVFDGIKQIFGGLTEFLAGVFSGDWQRAWDGIKDIFGGVWNAFVGIVKAPINKIIGFLNKFLSGVQSMANAIAKALSFDIDLPDAIEKLTGVDSFSLSIPKISVPKIPYLANGGIVNSGQMFVARENGLAEMVGRIGNHTAVANNDQIVASVSEGVKQAVVEAMLMTGGMNADNGQAPVIELTIKTSEETLYRSVKKGQEKYRRRYQIIEEF